MKTAFLMSLLLVCSITWSQKKAKIQMVNEASVVEGAIIQPKEALSIAAPYLDDHATDHWNPDKPLQTYIVVKGRYYYVCRTNYPAKALNYYLQPAVKINKNNGVIRFTTLENKKN